MDVRGILLKLRAGRRAVGRRGAFLLFLAELDAVIGASMRLQLPYGLTAEQVYGLFARVAPIIVWSDAFLIVGLVCATAALWHPARPVAFLLAAAIKTLWGLLYAIAWVTGDMSRGYFSAAIWLTFAGLVLIVSAWPEDASRLHER